MLIFHNHFSSLTAKSYKVTSLYVVILLNYVYQSYVIPWTKLHLPLSRPMYSEWLLTHKNDRG